MSRQIRTRHHLTERWDEATAIVIESGDRSEPGWSPAVWNPRALRVSLAVWPAALLLGIGGCGSASHRPVTHVADTKARLPVCQPRVRSAIATELQVTTAAVSTSASVGNNGMPQCTFTTHAAGRVVSVVANVDNGPQVGFRIERTVVEASQIFGKPPPGWKPPIGLYGLGPYASWFPTRGELMATNGRDLLTIGVDWNGVTRGSRIKLARAALGPYMKEGHKLKPQSNTGYPG